MDFDIRIGAYRLMAMASVEVKKSVETLASTATIMLPAYLCNDALAVSDKLAIGNEVTIALGYDEHLETEFKGRLNAIRTDNGSLVLECIDGLYNFKVDMKDAELKGKTLKGLLQMVVDTVNANKETENYQLDCSYESGYDKFIICKATGYDVLKKVQEDFKANIYFDGKTLHCHAPYSQIVNREAVVYDFAVNIEKSDLKYVLQRDKKTEVEVVMQKPDGSTVKRSYGTPGGEKKSVMTSGVNEAELGKIAKENYNVWCFDGYEGSFTGWLVPFVEPGYKVRIEDRDFPQKSGDYYVIATEVRFSESGGERKVMLGRRIT